MLRKDEIFRDSLHKVYRDLYDLVGYETMVVLYQHFHGYQINFPAKLYSKEGIGAIIREEYDGNNIQELAREYGYSDRWIRTLVTRMEKEECND